jgi:putative ABC transport system substrate-binding protein
MIGGPRPLLGIGEFAIALGIPRDVCYFLRICVLRLDGTFADDDGLAADRGSGELPVLHRQRRSSWLGHDVLGFGRLLHYGGEMRRRSLMVLLGGALSRPLVARAQQKAMPVIGWLSGASPGQIEAYLAAFRQGLAETGYVEGQTVSIEYRWAENHYDRLPGLAAQLVGREVDVIATNGGEPSAFAAKKATSTIPIVSVVGQDPVATGLVASFARPSGNLTGFTILNEELIAKRLELLCDLLPRAKVIALLVNPTFPQTGATIRDMQEAARVKGVALPVLKASSESETDAAFASLAELRVDGLVVEGNPFFEGHREQLITLAVRQAVPAIYSRRVYTEAGGLISYGSSLTAIHRENGIYVGKILNGAKPADLPVQQPTKFELVVNLKTANALGLTVPPSILARADEVIE